MYEGSMMYLHSVLYMSVVNETSFTTLGVKDAGDVLFCICEAPETSQSLCRCVGQECIRVCVF